MTGEQRWAASGVVVLLGAIWGGIALVGVTAPWRHTGPPDDSMGLVWVWLIACVALVVAVVWLVLGLVTVRRVASGSWRWWPAAGLSGGAAVWSLVAAAAATPEGPAWWVLLLGFQSLALFAWAVLLWTPARPAARPPAAADHDAAGDDRVRGGDA